MDKVFIVEWRYNFSGSSIIAVFPSEEMADGFIKNHKDKDSMFYTERDILIEY